MFTMDHLGRKPLMVASMLVGGIFTLICALFEEGGLRTGMAIMGETERGTTKCLNHSKIHPILPDSGKFGASSSFSVIYLWSSELYPSEIRGTAMGMCSLFGRLGGIAAPQVHIYTEACPRLRE